VLGGVGVGGGGWWRGVVGFVRLLGGGGWVVWVWLFGGGYGAGLNKPRCEEKGTQLKHQRGHQKVPQLEQKGGGGNIGENRSP